MFAPKRKHNFTSPCFHRVRAPKGSGAVLPISYESSWSWSAYQGNKRPACFIIQEIQVAPPQVNQATDHSQQQAQHQGSSVVGRPDHADLKQAQQSWPIRAASTLCFQVLSVSKHIHSTSPELLSRIHVFKASGSQWISAAGRSQEVRRPLCSCWWVS